MGCLREIIEKYIQHKQIFDVIEFFKDNGIGLLYFNSRSNMNIKIVNTNNILKNKQVYMHHSSNYCHMIGGKKYELDVKIQNIKYQVQIDEYYDMDSINNITSVQNIKTDEYKKFNINDIKFKKNKNRKIINFIKFNAVKNNNSYEENDHCGVMIIDKEKKISTIQSITNYTNCVKCLSTGEVFFKTGDILTQIMIIISLKNNLKKIYLTDNSYLLCGNTKIPLIYLRTITRGMPFYSKYRFIPKYKYDEKVFNINLENYKKGKTLTKKQFINYFNYMEFDPTIKKHKKILKYINDILIPRLDKINLVSDIIKSIINDKTIEGCSLLNNILMKIYDEIKYINGHKNFKRFLSTL
jgi:hypothetical protein